MTTRPAKPRPGPDKPRSLRPLILIFLISIAPVALALLAYYVPALGFRPDSTSNYGALIEPQRPMPPKGALTLTTLEGEPFDLHSLSGKWILMTADQGACPESCVKKLFTLRNSHASQGKDVKRLTRVWFVLDDAPVSDQVLEAYGGTHIVRADPAELVAWLAPKAGGGDISAALAGPMWIVDPLDHLMMAFPPDADPIEVRDDIRKLLRTSQIG